VTQKIALQKAQFKSDLEELAIECECQPEAASIPSLVPWPLSIPISDITG
jgi:hypothetical protein